MRTNLLVALLALFVSTTARAQVPLSSSNCISRLTPAPALPLPDWWDPPPATNPNANRPFDAAWAGASKQDFSTGAQPHVTVRAGYAPSATGPNDRDLYLQWIVWFSPTAGPAPDGLWFVLSPDGSTIATPNSAGAVAFHMTLDTTQTGPDPHNVNFDTNVYYRSTGSSTWATVAAPAWLAATGRQFIGQATDRFAWAFAIKIPLRAAATVNNPSAGLPVSSTGAFAYMYQIDVTNPGATQTSYVWPNGTPLGNTTPTVGWPQKFGNFQIDTANCPSVSIAASGIHTDYTGDDHAIHTSSSNTFHAAVANLNTAGAANGVTAQFRIADWGSQGYTFNAGDTPWLTIGTSTPTNIGAATSPTTPTTADLQATWNPSADPNWHPGNHSAHQCILVELTGSGGGGYPNGILFAPDSAWTNMHFGGASTFTEDAVVSIVGLPPIGGNAKRDLYLYFEQHNMPEAPPAATASPDMSKPRSVGNETARTTVVPSRPQAALVPLPTLELDNLTTPNYRVHVYHDTGLRALDARGVRHIVLEPQGDYGWFIRHTPANGRELSKTTWSAQTVLNRASPLVSSGNAGAALTRITDSFYKLTLDNKSRTVLTTTITATDPTTPSLPRWLLLLLAAAVLLLLLILWLRR